MAVVRRSTGELGTRFTKFASGAAAVTGFGSCSGPDSALMSEAVAIGASLPPPGGGRAGDRVPVGGPGSGSGRGAMHAENGETRTTEGAGRVVAGRAIDPGDVPDDVLARRAGMGDKQAFADLVDRHGPGLHRHVSRLLRDRTAVEDCLQETLLAAWRGLRGFRGEASVRTWLFAIARRQAFAHARRVPQSGSVPYLDHREAVERIADLRDDPANVGAESALLQAVDVALSLLPERQRSAWLLKEVEGLTYQEIGRVLHVSPDAVRGLLARARTTLARMLEEWR